MLGVFVLLASVVQAEPWETTFTINADLDTRHEVARGTVQNLREGGHFVVISPDGAGGGIGAVMIRSHPNGGMWSLLRRS